MSNQSPGSHEFEFELDQAISEQVLSKMDKSPEIPLTKDTAPQDAGVYVLFRNGTRVYIGKASRDSTESERDLRQRLNEHYSKIKGRKNIAVTEMTCKYLTITSDWFVWAAERALITAHNPTWNASGFGNKDTGKGRDRQAPSNFDNDFPIEEAFVCGTLGAGQHTARQVLQFMKQKLPYTFRYETKGTASGDSMSNYYKTIPITLAANTYTAEQLLQEVVNALGKDWQGTIFKSHIILYRENADYPHAVKVIRKP